MNGHHAALWRVHARRRGDELGEEHGDDDEDGQNVERVGRGEIGEPEPVGLAQLDGVLQHAEVGEEQRHLQQHGQAAAVHVDALVFVERHHLGVHLGPLGVGGFEMGVSLLEGLHLGLDAHHLQRRLHHHEAGGQQSEVEDDGEDDDGPTPVVGCRIQQSMKSAGRDRAAWR